MSMMIHGGTLIDGVHDEPITDRSIWIEDGRIKAIGRREDLGTAAMQMDARGKYLIPGLMNANVHLAGDVRLESLARHLDCLEDVIVEAAQVALKSGITTVFDTWGPRRFLMSARDRINAGERIGSRIFCAGNIVGFDGPFSQDFLGRDGEVASAGLTRRINSIWVENVGRHLMWLTAPEVAEHIRAYIARGIDFIKYASNEHSGDSCGAMLAFSPRVQRAIVGEAHRAGLTAQAHTMSVEGLRIAVEAGCNLIQHANITGPVPVPDETLQLMASGKTGAVVFAWTQRMLDVMKENSADPKLRTIWHAADTNARNLMSSGAPILLANDGVVFSAERIAELERQSPSARLYAGEDRFFDLGLGHFTWFEAMEEKGMPAMDMLKAATRNIAVAYGQDKDLGTLEPGKIADIVVLDRNPLERAENFRFIHCIVKDGQRVERDGLPTKPVVTLAAHDAAEEEGRYIPFHPVRVALPICPACVRR